MTQGALQIRSLRSLRRREVGSKGSTSPETASAKTETPFDKQVVGVKGNGKADFAANDQSAYKNAQVIQPVQ